VVLDGSEHRVGDGCSLSGHLTAAQMELLECLVENKSAKQDSSVVYNEVSPTFPEIKRLCTLFYRIFHLKGNTTLLKDLILRLGKVSTVRSEKSVFTVISKIVICL